jgi:hypothetical protein
VSPGLTVIRKVRAIRDELELGVRELMVEKESYAVD